MPPSAKITFYRTRKKIRNTASLLFIPHATSSSLGGCGCGCRAGGAATGYFSVKGLHPAELIFLHLTHLIGGMLN